MIAIHPYHLTFIEINPDDYHFYHTIDLPGVSEMPGEWGSRNAPDEYLRNVILPNKRVFSVGTANGFWPHSFLSAKGNYEPLYTRDSGKTWVRILEFDGIKNEVRLVSSSRHPSDTLCISITTFDCQLKKHRHKVYRRESDLPS